MSFRRNTIIAGCVSLAGVIAFGVLVVLVVGLVWTLRSQNRASPPATVAAAAVRASTATATFAPRAGATLLAPVTFTPTPPAPPASPQGASVEPSPPAAATATATPPLTTAAPPASAAPATAAPPPSATRRPTNTPAAATAPPNTATATASSTPTATPTPPATPTPTPSPPPTATGTPPPTPTPLRFGRIVGWVALNGSPVGQGIRLKLEDQSYTPVAEATTDANGVYTFLDLDPSEQGYNVLFAQEWNQNFEIDQVISWGWMGPVVVQAGSALELPDFEISPLGFKQVSPESNSTFSAAAISAANPIRFEWSAYPQAATYWVDLARGEEQPVLWQSLLVEAGPVEFDGTLSDSSHIQPGDYWWGVGARRPVEAYIVTVYGLQQRLTIEP